MGVLQSLSSYHLATSINFLASEEKCRVPTQLGYEAGRKILISGKYTHFQYVIVTEIPKLHNAKQN
jgi:hypothetical protein